MWQVQSARTARRGAGAALAEKYDDVAMEEPQGEFAVRRAVRIIFPTDPVLIVAVECYGESATAGCWRNKKC